MPSSFLANRGGRPDLDTVRAGLDLGFANVTVFAGSRSNKHTVTGVTPAAHVGHAPTQTSDLTCRITIAAVRSRAGDGAYGEPRYDTAVHMVGFARRQLFCALAGQYSFVIVHMFFLSYQPQVKVLDAALPIKIASDRLSLRLSPSAEPVTVVVGNGTVQTVVWTTPSPLAASNSIDANSRARAQAAWTRV